MPINCAQSHLPPPTAGRSGRDAKLRTGSMSDERLAELKAQRMAGRRSGDKESSSDAMECVVGHSLATTTTTTTTTPP